MWLKHSNFINIVHKALSSPTLGNPIQKFSIFTSCFRHLAHNWNINNFGNLFQQKENLQTNIQAIQQVYFSSQDPNLLVIEQHLGFQLQELNMAEKGFWNQRARTNWLSLGDKNTSFQTQALIRRKRKQILKIKDDNGFWFDNDEQNISYVFVSSFKKRFSLSSSPSLADIQECISVIYHCISVEDNAKLLAPVNLEEINIALYQIGPLKAPGPDGIHATFYHTYWPQLKDVLFAMVTDFFQNKSSLSIMNHTNIALIPKCDNLDMVTDFRPISLCNVSYKIISKVIVNRFRPLLAKCISQNLGGFYTQKINFR